MTQVRPNSREEALLKPSWANWVCYGCGTRNRRRVSCISRCDQQVTEVEPVVIDLPSREQPEPKGMNRKERKARSRLSYLEYQYAWAGKRTRKVSRAFHAELHKRPRNYSRIDALEEKLRGYKMGRDRLVVALEKARENVRRWELRQRRNR